MPRAKPPPAALLASPDEIEAQFYEALQQGDIERLMALWADDDDIACVHPGGPRVMGHAAIRASFESIFANGAIPVVPDHVRRLTGMTHAVHHVAERVNVNTDQGPKTAWVLATNVYVKGTQGWKLVLHHASPGTVGETPPTVGETPSTLH
jgi:uncharacterized protein (TIGR02246 family)